MVVVAVQAQEKAPTNGACMRAMCGACSCSELIEGREELLSEQKCEQHLAIFGALFFGGITDAYWTQPTPDAEDGEQKDSLAEAADERATANLQLLPVGRDQSLYGLCSGFSFPS